MKLFYRMHKKLCIGSIIGIIFVSTIGTLLHFVYQWSGCNSIVGLAAPVNESTWEHMKLLYFPAMLYFLAEYIFLCKDYHKLLRADLAAVLTGTLLIPVIFYTYTGILGTHSLILDILTFFSCVIAAFAVRLRSLTRPSQQKYTFLYFICVLVLGVCFLIFTYYPPAIALFVSP